MIKKQNYQLIFIIIFSIVFLFCKLWEGGLASYDDCYYAEQSKEILLTNDWLTMHYAGEPNYENDPVCLWFIAVMFKLFGISEFTARFHSALFGIGTIILVYFLGKMLFNQWVGFFSSLILLTTQIFTKNARHAMLDIGLAFFVTLSIFFFVKGMKLNKKQNLYFVLFGLSTGIAILTKSLLGFFPLLITFFYLLFSGNAKKIFNPFYIFGIILAILLPSSWWLYNYIKNGQEFLNSHFGNIIFHRAFIAGKGEQTLKNYLTYPRDLLVFYWPWIPFALFGIIKMGINVFKKKDTNALLLLLWIFITIIILSISHSRHIRYILPIFPAFSIITAYVFDTSILKKERLKIQSATVFLLVLTFVSLIIIATPVKLDWDRNKDIKTIAPYVKSYLSCSKESHRCKLVLEGLPEEKVIAYKIKDYWPIQLPFLFYSNYSITRPINDKIEFLKMFDSNKKNLCLSYYNDYKDLEKNYPLLVKYNDIVLFTNKAEDKEDVKPVIITETPLLEIHR